MNRRTFTKLAGAAGLATVLDKSGLAEAPQSAAMSQKRNDPWSGYFFGTAYYPEWWQPADWPVDFKQMESLGINTVRMGEFAWAIYEPRPGKYDFGWMDRAIDIANSHGIQVVLGTPTASVPPWLYQMHPDVLSGNSEGLYTYGGRKGYCTSSANYQEACANIVGALASHYGNHPGVVGWQLDNEPGYPFESFDPVSERAFQHWLQQRYRTLDTLNREWNGAFWSNRFTDWSQIKFPTNSAEGGWQPAITLAYHQFFSDSFLQHLRQQAKIIRKFSANQFIFTNWPSPAWSVDTFAAAAEFLDATAWDNYVISPGIEDFQQQYIAGFNHDFSRCAGPHQRFLCAEQIAYVPAGLSDQGLRLQAYIDLAHGSHGHLYFEWRRPKAGGEQFRPSLIKRFDGSINPAKPIFVQTSNEFARLGPRLSHATTQSDIALLYDFKNKWAQGMGHIGDTRRPYDGEITHYYRGFKTLQRNIDVIPLNRNFSTYKVILAPNLHLIDDATVTRLQSFVAQGGILVLNYRAGTQNSDNSMRSVLPPGPFSGIAGVSAESTADFIEYPSTNHDTFSVTFPDRPGSFHPHTTLESLKLHGAEPLATIASGSLRGSPVITKCAHGKGWTFYVSMDCQSIGFYEAIAARVGAAAGLSPLIAAPYGVEVVSREDSTNVYYFLLNLTENSHTNIALPHPMDDMLDKNLSVDSISLAPFGVAVLSSKRMAS